MAAAPGNQYAAKAKESERALTQALLEIAGEPAPEQITRFRVLVDYWKGVITDGIAENKLDVLKEMTDRLDGKPKQTSEHTGPEGSKLTVVLSTDDTSLL